MGLHSREGLSDQRYGHWVLGDDQSKGFWLPSRPGDGCGRLRLPFPGVWLPYGEPAFVFRQTSLRLKMTNPRQTVSKSCWVLRQPALVYMKPCILEGFVVHKVRVHIVCTLSIRNALIHEAHFCRTYIINTTSIDVFKCILITRAQWNNWCALFQGSAVFCIITKLLITRNQVQGKCAEVRTH